MVLRSRRKRLRVTVSDDESAEDVAEFEGDGTDDSDFEAAHVKTPEFDDLFLSDRISLSQQPSQQDGQAWVDKYSSISLQGGLVTSIKKSNEIRNWMRGALDGVAPRLLLLTGPPGCGKSSAIRAAATEFECAVSSWQAPVTGSRNISMTLLDDFRAFFVGGRYHSLAGEEESEAESRDWSGRKILLVEDLPVCTTDIAQKRAMIQKVFVDTARFAPFPTAVVISDSEKGVASTARFIFGADLLESSNIAFIKVPAVTHGMMKRKLLRVLQGEGLLFSQDKLEGAVAVARGDIRAALNALQFCSSTEIGTSGRGAIYQEERESKKRRKRRKRTSGYTLRALDSVGHDATLGTYHAVSKILNNKRDVDGESRYNVEDVLADAKADPASFLEFLHHNYPDFFSNIDDVVGALECLSEADSFLQWRQDNLSRAGLWDCAASLGTRGFLYHNSKPSQAGWRPIRGPESYEVRREGRAHIANAQQRFTGMLAPTVYTQSSVCEVVPYCEKITESTVSEWGRFSEQMKLGRKPTNGIEVVNSRDNTMMQAQTEHGAHPFLDKNSAVAPLGTEVDPIVDWDDDEEVHY